MSDQTCNLSRRSFVRGASVLGISAGLCSISPLMAHAATASEKQAEANAALSKLDAVNEKLHQAENDFELAEYERQCAQDAMDDAQGRIDEASDRIGDLQLQLGERARSMYRTGSSTFIDLLLGATTFKAFTNNWGLLNDMNESDAEMVQETKDLRAVVEEQERVEAEKAAAAEEAKTQTEALVNEAQATYDSLTAEAAEALEAERQARAAAMLTTVQANMAATGTPSGTGSSSSGGKGSTNYYNGAASYSPGNVVANAYAMLGQPYVSGGAAPGGFDCSGLVGWCIAGGRQGSDAFYGAWPQTSDPQPGDVCWRAGHVGIYIGGGQMIHASDYGVGVIIGPVQSNMTIHRQP